MFLLWALLLWKRNIVVSLKLTIKIKEVLLQLVVPGKQLLLIRCIVWFCSRKFPWNTVAGISYLHVTSCYISCSDWQFCNLDLLMELTVVLYRLQSALSTLLSCRCPDGLAFTKEVMFYQWNKVNVVISLTFLFDFTFCELLWRVFLMRKNSMFVCRQQSSGSQMNPSELTACAGDITAFTKVINL